MKLNYVTRNLKSLGYTFTIEKVNKNGVIHEGIAVDNGTSAHVVIYPERYTKMADILDDIKNVKLGFDTSEITSEQYILDHVYVALAERVDKEIVQIPTPWEPIKAYLYVRLNEAASYKLRHEMVKEITTDTLWSRALRNTKSETRIFSMSDIGLPVPGNNIFVVTNKSGFRGASAVLDMETLKRELPSGKYFMLPSSIHEVLLVKDNGIGDLDGYIEMVGMVNAEVVNPEEQLTDNAYEIEL